MYCVMYIILCLFIYYLTNLFLQNYSIIFPVIMMIIIKLKDNKHTVFICN